MYDHLRRYIQTVSTVPSDHSFSSLMTLFVKMCRVFKSASLKSHLLIVMSLLLRYATYISPELCKLSAKRERGQTFESYIVRSIVVLLDLLLVLSAVCVNVRTLFVMNHVLYPMISSEFWYRVCPK
jgi:hypothetical protein